LVKVRGFGFKPLTKKRIFIHHSFGSKAKRCIGMSQPTWHSCMCCNPANGRVDFEGGWLIKIQPKTFLKTLLKKKTNSKILAFFFNEGKMI